MNFSIVLCIFAVIGFAAAGHFYHGHDNGLGYGAYSLYNGGYAHGIGSYGGHGTHGHSGFRGYGGYGHGFGHGYGFYG